MTFLLGDESRENAKRSLKALKAHAVRDSEARAPEKAPIFLVLNTTRTLFTQKDYTPRVIPVTHKLHRIDERSIALIARDSSYKKRLVAPGPTEDLFHEIVPFSKLKSIAGSKEKSIRFFKENDVLLADARIHKRLPEILGSKFFGKNKKVPFKVLMCEPVPKNTHGKTDQLCDPKYVRAQVKSIMGNTSFIAPGGGTCFHVVVGYADWKVSELLTNINDVVDYLTNEQNLPNGGVLHTIRNLHSVLVKLSDGVALPVMPKREVE